MQFIFCKIQEMIIEMKSERSLENSSDRYDPSVQSLGVWQLDWWQTTRKFKVYFSPIQHLLEQFLTLCGFSKWIAINFNCYYALVLSHLASMEISSPVKASNFSSRKKHLMWSDMEQKLNLEFICVVYQTSNHLGKEKFSIFSIDATAWADSTPSVMSCSASPLRV